jgi:integrase
MRASPASLDPSDSFEDWAQNEKGYAAKTIKDYRLVIRHLGSWAEAKGYAVPDLTTAQLRSYLFSTRPTARTRNARRCALMACYEHVISTGARLDNPAMALPRLPEKKLLPKPLPREIVPSLIEAARRRGPRELALVCLYLFTGLRLSEVQNLAWSQVAFEWMCLVKKGGDERTVYLPEPVREALAAWRARAPRSQWVFESDRLPGQPLSKSWFERTIKALGSEAGLPLIWPHRLRHTFGTALYASTGDIFLVQKAMGHASVKSTEIYTEVVQPDIKAAVDRLSFGGPMRPPTT